MPTTIPKKNHAKRNRSAGHGFECDMAKAFRELGFEHVVTSRSENRSRDNEKVDLVNKNELRNGRLLYNVQCKCESKAVSYIQLLSEMPKEQTHPNVVFHRKTEKSKGGKFMVKGEYAILNLKDFLQMVGELQKRKKR